MRSNDGAAPPARPVGRLWLDLRPGIHEPSRLLMLVPHAGAGPSSLREIEKYFPPDWGVFALALPGRELRVAEAPEWDVAAVSREAARSAASVRAAAGRAVPLLLAGQCSGAWLAYAILDQGGAELQQLCRGLFIIAQTPWHLPRSPDLLPDDSDTMWAHLLATGDTPPDVAGDAEMRELLEPVIRADYAAVARFPSDARPVNCPIVAVSGERDPYFRELRPSEWARYTSSLRTVLMLCGHFPMQESPAQVAQVIVSMAGDE